MSTNILLLLMLSALISGTAAVFAWMGGWGLIGAFLVYSLGGSMTLLLLAGLATWLGGYDESDLAGAPVSDQST
jgi:hypothetical protein